MNSRHFITSALTAGGVLTVKGAMLGKSIFRAEMAWPNEQPPVDPIKGALGLGLESALDQLEKALARIQPLNA